MKPVIIAFGVSMFWMAPSALALSAEQSVLKEHRAILASGDERIEYRPATLVVPGETVLYRLDYINDKADPVTDMVLTMPVPTEVIYQEGSADRDGVTASFSADGGETFYARDALVVQLDVGSGPAVAEDITHIRWTAEAPLAPGASGVLEFKGTLK